MSEPVSISSGIAARYATAVFEIAKESGALASLENDIDALAAALDQSADFVSLIKSPIYSRAEAGAAIGALAKALGLSQLVSNTLGLMAAKRRLFVLPQLLAALREQIARDRGEVTAEVISAKALTKAQTEKLAAAIKSGIGKDVNLNAAVDESLIGGLVVKVGSTMIDSSIKAKLANLQNAMKEVG